MGVCKMQNPVTEIPSIHWGNLNTMGAQIVVRPINNYNYIIFLHCTKKYSHDIPLCLLQPMYCLSESKNNRTDSLLLSLVKACSHGIGEEGRGEDRYPGRDRFSTSHKCLPTLGDTYFSINYTKLHVVFETAVACPWIYWLFRTSTGYNALSMHPHSRSTRPIYVQIALYKSGTIIKYSNLTVRIKT